MAFWSMAFWSMAFRVQVDGDTADCAAVQREDPAVEVEFFGVAASLAGSRSRNFMPPLNACTTISMRTVCWII